MQSQLFQQDSGYSVNVVSKPDTHHLLMNVHYARRIPAISHAFGLFLDGALKGVITYGKPPSRTLCSGVCGHDWSHKVLELNRLCLIDNSKNEASRLVGQSLRLLPKPTIVVSFADTSQGHAGIVYQATNFIYTGLSHRQLVWYVMGEEHIHPRALSHQGSLAELRQKYGDRLYSKERARKHRYVCFVGSRTQKKQMTAALRYTPQPYPSSTQKESN